MNPGFGGQRVATIRQSTVAKLLKFVQGRKFILKNLLQVSFCISGDFALRQIKTESGQRRDNDHHRGEQSSAKARYAFIPCFNGGAHGKSTCSVWPFFTSTAFSLVVLLSIHAFSV